MRRGGVEKGVRRRRKERGEIGQGWVSWPVGERWRESYWEGFARAGSWRAWGPVDSTKGLVFVLLRGGAETAGGKQNGGINVIDPADGDEFYLMTGFCRVRVCCAGNVGRGFVQTGRSEFHE